jgi:hypothetical protein
MELFLHVTPEILTTTHPELQLRLGLPMLRLWSTLKNADGLGSCHPTVDAWLSLAADLMWELFLLLGETFLVLCKEDNTVIAAASVAQRPGSAADTPDKAAAAQRGQGAAAAAAAATEWYQRQKAASLMAAGIRPTPALTQLMADFNKWSFQPGFTRGIATSLKLLWHFWVPNMYRMEHHEVQGWLAQSPNRLGALYRFICSNETMDWVLQGVTVEEHVYSASSGGYTCGCSSASLSCRSTSEASSTISSSSSAAAAGAAGGGDGTLSMDKHSPSSSLSSSSSKDCLNLSLSREALGTVLLGRVVTTWREESLYVEANLTSLAGSFQEVLQCCLRWTWGIKDMAETAQLEQQQQQQQQEEGGDEVEDEEEEEEEAWRWDEQQEGQQQQQQQQKSLAGRVWTYDTGDDAGLAPFLLAPPGKARFHCGGNPITELEALRCGLDDAVIKAVKAFFTAALEESSTTSSSSNSEGGNLEGGNSSSSSSSRSTKSPLLVTRGLLAVLVRMLQCLPAMRPTLIGSGEYQEQVSNKLLLLCVALRVASVEVREEFLASSDGKELLRILLVLLLLEDTGQGLAEGGSTSRDSNNSSRVSASYQQQGREAASRHTSSSASEELQSAEERGEGVCSDDESVLTQTGFKWLGSFSDLGGSQGNLDPSVFMGVYKVLPCTIMVSGLPSLITQVLSCLLLEPPASSSKRGAEMPPAALAAETAAAPAAQTWTAAAAETPPAAPAAESAAAAAAPAAETAAAVPTAGRAALSGAPAPAMKGPGVPSREGEAAGGSQDDEKIVLVGRYTVFCKTGGE